MEIFDMPESKIYIAIYFVYITSIFYVLSILSKNALQKVLVFQFANFFIFYILVFRRIDYTDIIQISGVIVSVVFLIAMTKVVYDSKKLPKQKFKNILFSVPVFLTLLFMGSLMLGIEAINFHKGWYWGYILSTISFLIGIYLYRKQIFDHKK